MGGAATLQFQRGVDVVVRQVISVAVPAKLAPRVALNHRGGAKGPQSNRLNCAPRNLGALGARAKKRTKPLCFGVNMHGNFGVARRDIHVDLFAKLSRGMGAGGRVAKHFTGGSLN